MENSSNKSRSLFLKFLPKAASAVSFQYSPGRDHHHHHHSSTKLKAHAHKGFSGPINFAVLPDEARSKPNKDGSFEAHEPTSPKVSCMGQIKKKKLMKKIASKNSNMNKNIKNNNNVSFFNIFNSSKKSKGSQGEVHGKKGRIDTLDNNSKKVAIPSLGQMRKFASGRESLANFEWTAQIAPLDHDDHREYYSDDEERRRVHSDDDDDDDEDDSREVIVPYSAPILIGGRSRDDDDVMMGEKRKEVNLWKRRTMAPPPPLSLKSKVR